MVSLPRASDLGNLTLEPFRLLAKQFWHLFQVAAKVLVKVPRLKHIFTQFFLSQMIVFFAIITKTTNIISTKKDCQNKVVKNLAEWLVFADVGALQG